MRAEFHRAGAPEGEPVTTVTWTGSRVEPGEAPDDLAEAIGRIFRAAPVVVDDPSLRSVGTSGPVILEPGDLTWFIAAARSRADAEGLVVRFVPPDRKAMGWDPAGAYRTFPDAVERRDRAAGVE